MSDTNKKSTTYNRETINERERLIEKIKQRQIDHGRDLNVLIIGTRGSGKSSFINSISTAFSRDRWEEYATSGSHGAVGGQITVCLESFLRCNSREQNLPNLIDLAGLADENDDYWVEIFRIILYGRMQEGESVQSLVDYYSKWGLPSLKKRYTYRKDHLKIDRIIFATSATSPIPMNLIEAVLKAARPPGKLGEDTRTVPIYGVILKADKIDQDELPNALFETREHQFLSALGLLGSSHRYMKCANYCDDMDPAKLRLKECRPDIDIPILEFMNEVCGRTSVVNQTENYNQRYCRLM